MKKVLKLVVILIATIFIILQLFQVDKTNPPIVEAETLEAAVAVPPDIQLIIGRSCNDCHSNKTIYPWYASIQPSGWFLRDHIDHGRDELNMSKFNTYENKKKKRKLEEICDEVDVGAMPLPSYLWLHGDAVVSETEKKALCDWTKSAIASIGE